MTDLFEELASSFDPVEATEKAKAGVKRVLPKRFYATVTAAPGEGGYHLLLDGRPVKTPARRPLVVDDIRVACAVEAEWAEQGEFVDPAEMPMTRLVNSAIDGVAEETAKVADEIVAFAYGDQILYRAETPDRLVARQKAAWDPVVAWAEKLLGVSFRLTTGVVHVEQDEALGPALRRRLPELPLPLAAFHTATSLTGSALLALALGERHLPVDVIWQIAHIDEDWNAELWGLDDEAKSRLAFRRREFDAAAVALGI